MWQDFFIILFNLLPLALFLYLSLSLLGVFKLNAQTAFLAKASTTTKIAIYGGTIAFAVMAVVDLTK
jgi:hypothetical protein